VFDFFFLFFFHFVKTTLSKHAVPRVPSNNYCHNETHLVKTHACANDPLLVCVEAVRKLGLQSSANGPVARLLGYHRCKLKNQSPHAPNVALPCA